MADKLMYIVLHYNVDTQNYTFCLQLYGTLDTQQNEPTNQNSLKVKTVIVEQSGHIIG